MVHNDNNIISYFSVLAPLIDQQRKTFGLQLTLVACDMIMKHKQQVLIQIGSKINEESYIRAFANSTT